MAASSNTQVVDENLALARQRPVFMCQALSVRQVTACAFRFLCQRAVSPR